MVVKKHKNDIFSRKHLTILDDCELIKKINHLEIELKQENNFVVDTNFLN